MEKGRKALQGPFQTTHGKWETAKIHAAMASEGKEEFGEYERLCTDMKEEMI